MLVFSWLSVRMHFAAHVRDVSTNIDDTIETPFATSFSAPFVCEYLSIDENFLIIDVFAPLSMKFFLGAGWFFITSEKGHLYRVETLVSNFLISVLL